MEFEGKLSDYAEVVMGQSPSGENVSAQIVGPPLLNGPTEFGPSHPRPVQWTRDPKKFAKSGNILFCVRGSTTGRMNWADQTYAIGRGLAAIRGKNGFDIRFIRGVIETGLPDLLALATGSTFPNVGRDDLLAIPAPMISLEGSIAIGSVLKAISDRIDHNRALAANLEAIARRLFKSWFVDFDPVRAKAAGEKPPGLADDIAALFPDRLVDSELGEIPEGWVYQPITRIASVLSGGTPKRSVIEYWDGDIPWYSVVDSPTDGNMFVVRTSEYITQLGLEKSAAKLLPAGVTILSARGTVGKLALTCCPMTINQSCYAIKGDLGDYFTYFTIAQSIEWLKQNVHGAVFDTITKATLDGMTVVTPSEKAIQAFEIVVKPLMVRIESSVRERLALSSIRDLLLPRLISGKLRVEDAEPIIEETLA